MGLDTNLPPVANPSRRPAWVLLASALVISTLVAACSSTTGSPTPPEDFGKRENPWFGCPSMEGMFQWPPVAGEYASIRIASNVRPWAGSIPVVVHGDTQQIRIEKEGGRITVRSGRADAPAQRWAYSEHTSWSCWSGMVEFSEVPVTDTREDFGCKGFRRGFRLARFKDGALAVGIKTVAHGCTTSVFSWGGQSTGSLPTPDRVYWSWSKLALAEEVKKE